MNPNIIDVEVDEFTGQLRRKVELQSNSLVYNPLNRNLLYTKNEVDARVSGRVRSIVAGTNVTVDSTDPANPIVNGSGGGGGGTSRLVSSKSTDFTAGAASATDYVYFTSGTTTATLPTAVGNTNRYTIKNVGSNTVTIATTAGQTIDSSSSATLPVANTSLDLISDGSNWQVV